MATKTAAKSRARSASKVPAKKPPAKKTASKSPAKETAAKKTSAKTAAESSDGRKYSPEASKNVEREMREMHEGKLTIGRSKKKVTNPKQAIAIGLAEARRAGEKIPPNPNE